MRRRIILIGVGVVVVLAVVATIEFQKGRPHTVKIELTGPPELTWGCNYKVDGESGKMSGSLPTTVTIRGRDIDVAVYKAGGFGGLEVKMSINGGDPWTRTLGTPSGSLGLRLSPRGLLGRGQAVTRVAD